MKPTFIPSFYSLEGRRRLKSMRGNVRREPDSKKFK